MSGGYSLHISGCNCVRPKIEYEKLRHRLHENTIHLSNFVRWKISQILDEENSKNDTKSMLLSMSEMVSDYSRFNLKDTSSIADFDGFEDWRKNKKEKLLDLIQRRLHYLQHPKDFKNTKKLLCKPDITYGFGFQIHQIILCFLVAYETERTLVLSESQSYGNTTWEDVFLPIGSHYTLEENVSWSLWPGNSTDQVIILMPKGINFTTPRPPYVYPLKIPKDMELEILRTQTDPAAWWVGQFLKYLWRPRPEILFMLTRFEKTMKFQRPVVGIHIRRSDKITSGEGSFHDLEEYMYHVKEFYRTVELHNPYIEKRIYIATDEPKIFSEARNKYPNYQIIGDERIARSAELRNRDSRTALNGLLMDIHFLSMADFVVCDFSSNVCRLVYEMAQYHTESACNRFRSVGRMYGQFGAMHTAVQTHIPTNAEEIELRINDSILVTAGVLSNGYSNGTNQRTHMTGVYPMTKVVKNIETFSFPTYPQVSDNVGDGNSEFNENG